MDLHGLTPFLSFYSRHHEPPLVAETIFLVHRFAGIRCALS